MKVFVEVELENWDERHGGPTLDRLELPKFDVATVLGLHMEDQTFSVHGVLCVVAHVKPMEG